MKSKEDIIRRYIKGIISIEYIGGCIYVSTKNVLARATILELLRMELSCNEILVSIKNQDGLLTYVFE